ncbi:MAG TPA: hypothetical protein VFQ51_16310 [Vicinamibacteria bacterium]|nr:hypothetical protein [Vicinamibacteria bacterium]
MRGRAVVVAVAILSALGGCRRREAQSVAQQQAEIEHLEKERDELRSRLGEMILKDARLTGMPQNSVRVGVPTALARTLVEKVLGGVADQVELRLANLRAHKEGTVKKIVTIGTYDLDVNIVEVKAHLQTGKPDLRFGGNQIAVSLPVTVVKGTGDANVRFKWDGKNVSGAVCGDMDVTRSVSGSVKQLTLDARGTLSLASEGGRILARPKFPETRVRLEVEPSAESWASVQALLDEKGGVCGYVLDKVDIKKVVQDQLAKGFNVRLPVEKLKPVAVPVGIQQQLDLAGRSLNLSVIVGELAITESTFWLGADVKVGAASAAASPAKSP